MNKFGDFGKIANNYSLGRKGYPKEVIEYLWELLGTHSPKIIDIGCGTGIGTRQLFEHGATAYGVDGDSGMVEAAKTQSDPEITFEVAPAERIPFQNEMFDGATAFQAFRWFANSEAVSEIARILKTNGVLFIVNKADKSNIIDQFHKVLREKYIKDEGRILPKHAERHKELLEQAGFQLLERHEFQGEVYFTLDETLAYCQSSSLWNKVREEKKEEAKKELTDLFSKYLVDGKIKQENISTCDPAIKIK